MVDTAVTVEQKRLRATRFDRGNCRLYVKDQNGSRYVLVDQGPGYQRWGLPRFELMSYSKCGEPDVPVRLSWVLEEGLGGTEFQTGLSLIHR